MSRAKDLENAVANLLDSKGLKYMRVSNYRCFKCGQVQNAKAKGFPDFEIFYPHFYVECKTGTGKLTPEQVIIKDLLEKAGVFYIVLRDNVDELVEFLECCSSKKPKKKPRKRRVLV